MSASILKRLLLFACLVLPCFSFCQIINTIAGTGKVGYTGNGGPATSAELNAPAAARVDDSGNVYIVDFNNQVIRKVSASGIITTIAGNGIGGYIGDGGPATAAELKDPDDLTFDSLGNIYITDGFYSIIRKVTISTGIITTVAGNGTWGFSGDGGQATAAQLFTPTGVYIDKRHNCMYIADEQNNRIRKVDMISGIITTVAGNGTSTYTGDGGPATAAALYFPVSVKTDITGNVYIDDASNNRIRKIDVATGIITTIVGNGKKGFAGDGGQATSAEVNTLNDVALDTLGDIYIADGGNNRIREIDKNTGIITTIVATGKAGFKGDGGPAILSEIFDPTSVSFDRHGNYYISDGENERIREVKVCPPLAPMKNLLLSDTMICQGSSAVLGVSGEGNISWYSLSTNGTYLGSGSIFKTGAIYSDTIFYVQDSLSCGVSARTAFNVTLIPVKVPSITGKSSICIGDSTTINASGATTYAWNTGATANSITVSPISNTMYSVLVSENGCKDSANILVTVSSHPLITACCDSTIFVGQSVALSASGGTSYLWLPNTGLTCNACPNPVASPMQTTTYTLMVTSDSGCSALTTISIDVTCGIVFVPEAFSPNGDGQNDVLYVRGDCIKTVQFDVFDRWGNRVFETTDKNIGWNGEYKSQPMNAGSYVYSVTATMYDGTIFTKKGNVALVR
jgi:gliding motility-associated-like protein